MTFGRQRVNMYREKTFSRKRRHCMSSGKQQSDKMIQMLVTFQLEPSPQSKDDIFDGDFRLSPHSRDILRHWLTPDQVQKRRPLPKRLSRLSATQEKKRPASEEKKQEKKKKRVSEEKKMKVSAENDPQKKKKKVKKAVSKPED